MGLIEKIIDYVGFDYLFKLIKELPLFYLKPPTFFKGFFNKNPKEKLIQILFYITLVVLLGYFLIDEITIRKLVKATIIEVAALFFAIIILSTSHFLISKFTQANFTFSNVVSFAVLVKILIAPFQIIFFGLFISFENYNFYFMSNFIVFILFIYIFIFSSIIFYSRLRDITINIFLNLFFLNALIFSVHNISFDNYSTFESTYYTDPIIEERIEHKNKLKDFYKYPTHKFLMVKGDSVYPYYTFRTPLDSAASGSIKESVEFSKSLKFNLDQLEEIIDTVKFERNRAFFKETQEFYHDINGIVNLDQTHLQETKVVVNNVIKSTVVMDENGEEELFEQMVLSLPKNLDQRNFNLFMKEQDLIKISNFASMPLGVITYLMPVYLLLDSDQTEI